MSEQIEETLARILSQLKQLDEIRSQLKQLDEIRAENKQLRVDVQELRGATHTNTEQIAELASDFSILRDEVALLKSESEVRDYQLGYPLTRALSDHQGSLRTAGYSMYAGGPGVRRRPPVPPPTEPAQSGVSFKPGHRKLGATRYD